MRWPLLAAWSLGACFSPSPPFGAPCADNGDCPSGQQCDVIENVCTFPTEPRTLRDDTAEDFAAGAYLDEVTIERQGFVGPVAYFTGGVRLTGISGVGVVGPETTFDDVIGTPPTGVTIARTLELDFGTAPPFGLDLGSNVDITVVVEGELALDQAGTWQLELVANDRGFLELAPPGSRDFQRVVFDDNTGTVGAFEVVTPGWHRFRGAFSNAGQASRFEVFYEDPNGEQDAFELDALRAPAGDLTGLVLDGFDDPDQLGPRGTRLRDAPLDDESFEMNAFGFDIGNTYGLRWSGQFLIDVAGDYAFTLDSRGGHRAWIDGAQVADVLTTSPELTTTAPIELAAGWHDLVIDIAKSGGQAGRLSFTVASGPDRAGASFPADHLRPVAGRGARWFGASRSDTLAIPDQGSATRSLQVELPATLTPLRVDARYQVNHPVLGTVGIELDPPNGSPITVLSVGDDTGSGDHGDDLTLPVANAGRFWELTASDTTADVMTGTIEYLAVTILGDGGVEPFERRYRYESAVHDLGDVTALGAITWGLRQATATETATVQVRSCDAADACASEPWTEVADGAVPAIELRRFFQYAVDVTTNGDVPTALDFVELAYSARGP